MNANTPTSESRGSHLSFPAFLEAAREQPIFVILGVQGSGTNLLRSILAGAFNFSIVQDQSLVFNAAWRVGQHPPTESVRREFDFICSRISPTTLTRKTRRRIKSNSSFDGIEPCFEAANIRSGSDLAHFVYAYSAFRRGTSLMAIKSDDLWETIEHIDAVLPNRRIILLTRDFRDNLLSITKKDFGPVEPLVAARFVKERFAHYSAEYDRASSEQRIHVRYEELLDAPDAFVARFCEHFGLAADGVLPPAVDTGRIRRNNTKKWAALSARQLAQCEAILREELETYGYEIGADPATPPGTADWLLAGGRDFVGRIPQKLRRLLARLGR